MCFLRQCGIPWNARPLIFGSLQSTSLMGTRILACGAHTSGKGMALIPSVTTPSQLCRYYPLWGPCPSWFYSPSKHIPVGENTFTHWREVIPYKHILICFPRRCEISWNARPPFLGHYSKWILAIYNMKSKNKMNINVKWTFNYSNFNVFIATVLNS